MQSLTSQIRGGIVLHKFIADDTVNESLGGNRFYPRRTIIERDPENLRLLYRVISDRTVYAARGVLHCLRRHVFYCLFLPFFIHVRVSNAVYGCLVWKNVCFFLSFVYFYSVSKQGYDIVTVVCFIRSSRIVRLLLESIILSFSFMLLISVHSNLVLCYFLIL